MGFIKEFKEFAVKGNVMDMAVGVIIGGAFGKIVTSLVSDVLMPLIGKLTGGVSFVDLFVNSMWKDHKVNTGGRDCNYLVDSQLKFRIMDAHQMQRTKILDDVIYARYNTEIGRGNQIPLWLLGFLY